MLDPAHSARLERRAAAREAARRKRQIAGVVAVSIVGLLVLVVAAFGGSPKPDKAAPHAARPAAPASTGLASAASARSAPLPPGGPLAPASVGGLAALWAPRDTVGGQPGTAQAYAAAARLPSLPGFLLIADRGNNRILVIDPAGNRVFLYPSPADVQAGRKLYYNDDTFVEPGGRYLIANEEDNHAIVRVGVADHSLSVLFGHPRDPGSDATHLNTPDDAYQLPDGSFTVADAYNCRILFIRGHAVIRQIGQSGECVHDPPRAIGAVNGDTPMPGGGVLVSEINGSWIDGFAANGKLLFTVQAPVGYPSDPQPLPAGRILLADYSNPGHIIVMDRGGKVLWRYGPSGGYGRLDHPSLAMALPNGDIAVNDDYRDRLVVIDPRLNRIVWQYGHTDVAGASPGFLNTPDGMDFIPAQPRMFSYLASPPDGVPDWGAVVHP
jgi:hypothetical protein